MTHIRRQYVPGSGDSLVLVPGLTQEELEKLEQSAGAVAVAGMATENIASLSNSTTVTIIPLEGKDTGHRHAIADGMNFDVRPDVTTRIDGSFSGY